jgi:hypothetical protein
MSDASFDCATSPSTTWLDQVVVQPIRLALVGVAIDIGLFKELANDPDHLSSITEMASTLNVDPLLLQRIVRTLAAIGDLKQVSADTFSNSAYSQALATTPMEGDFITGLDVIHMCLRHTSPASERYYIQQPYGC